jgi:hypothetical protein
VASKKPSSRRYSLMRWASSSRAAWRAPSAHGSALPSRSRMRRRISSSMDAATKFSGILLGHSEVGMRTVTRRTIGIGSMWSTARTPPPGKGSVAKPTSS